MTPSQAYSYWINHPATAPELKEELLAVQGSPGEVHDRFWKDLSFGTGGLRGVIGAGTNRLNVHTVGRATQGLAAYLRELAPNPRVCIAYDTRNMSLEFAQAAASVLCANGVETYVFDNVCPTPMLSFAVRYMRADAGIVITASHNPREYNGYKVYGSDGGQITDEAAHAIEQKIQGIELFDHASPLECCPQRWLHPMSEAVNTAYYQKVQSLTMRPSLIAQRGGNLRILYSPLHGSGNIPVRHILAALGFTQVWVVPEQELPNGDFPTVPYPNPEEPAVFELAKSMAESLHPDLVFATDPDCDRIGVLVRDRSGEFSVLTGNQVGALLCDYIIRTHQELGTMPQNPAVIKTIVTSDMAKTICQQHGVALFETLTGFKYIGELVGQWAESGAHSFLLGFEESYGYLAGDFVRDKDAVIASALIAEMALWYKEQNLSLYEAMRQLYAEYGHYREKLISVAMPGQEGQEKISGLLTRLRSDVSSILEEAKPAFVEDYLNGKRTDLVRDVREPLPLPRSNVLKYIFLDGSWLVLRPSGTEPKVKIYLAAAGPTSQAATERVEVLERLAQSLLS